MLEADILLQYGVDDRLLGLGGLVAGDGEAWELQRHHHRLRRPQFTLRPSFGSLGLWEPSLFTVPSPYSNWIFSTLQFKFKNSKLQFYQVHRLRSKTSMLSKLWPFT